MRMTATGNLGRLAAGGEALVAGLGAGMAADCREGGHVQQVAGPGAAATDGAAAAVPAGVAVERSDTEKGGGLAAVEGAELGHFGAEADGVDRTETGDGLDDGGAAGEPCVGGDGREHAPLAVGDVCLDGLEGAAGAGGNLGIEFAAELAQGDELLEELAAEGEQVAEQAQVVRLGRGGFQAIEEAELGEHGGVDAVVLGELAERLGEAAGLQGVD